MPRAKPFSDRALVSAAALLVVLAACSNHANAPSSSPSATTPLSPTPSGPPALTELDRGSLDPGTYTTSNFQVKMTFTLGSGWSLDQASPVIFSLTSPNGDSLGFGVPSPQQSPAQIAAAVRSRLQAAGNHPTSPQPVTVGGANGVEFEVTVQRAPVPSNFVILFHVVDNGVPNDFRLSKGEETRFLFLDVEGTTESVAVEAGKAGDFPRLDTAVRSVLNTVRFM